MITATRHATSLQRPESPPRGYSLAGGRALAALGTAPTKSATANLANGRNGILWCKNTENSLPRRGTPRRYKRQGVR